MGRWRLGFLLVGVLLVAGGIGVGAQAQRSHAALDQALVAEAQQREAILAAYFNHARDTILLTAQNPAFAEFYDTPGERTAKIEKRPELMAKVNGALSYLETLYPGRIGEACFIDISGAENARVVRDEVALPDELSSDESDNPFFGPTFAVPTGQAYQARPYVSTDTDEWVISNSTPIPGLVANAAIVHFEVTVESIRQAVAPSDPRFHVRIVDRTTHQIVVDSAVRQNIGAPLGGPAPKWLPDVIAQSRSAGLTRLAGQDVAYQRLDHGTIGSTSLQASNANDWVIVVSATAPPAAWSDQLAVGPLSVLAAALMCLILAGLGYRQHQYLLARRAGTDDLTGLANRGRFNERLAAAVPTSANGRVTVLLLDLDRFKAVNDTLGHHVGDQLLLEVASRLRSTVDPGHLVARLGGDEFAVLVPHTSDVDDPAELATRLRQAIRRTVVIEATPMTINTSIGIATAPDHAHTPARMLVCADVAMYHAKRTGAGVSTYSPDQDTDSTEILGMEAALLAALEYDHIELHYQPIVDLNSGDVTGVEALARWNHPELGLIRPAAFLPLAETTGLIHQLTRYILRLAVSQCSRWWADGLEVRVSVNLSPANCTDPNVPDELAAMMAGHELPASAIKLEITEHAALDIQAHPVIARLHDLGFGIALDDFGTGYSSLSHLKTLPVNEVKIDQSFVGALLADPTNNIIIRATATMAHGLGRTVTAEGVENEMTLNLLRMLGVDRVQGHFIAVPQPAAAMTQWLKDNHVGRQAGQRPSPAGSPRIASTFRNDGGYAWLSAPPPQLQQFPQRPSQPSLQLPPGPQLSSGPLSLEPQPSSGPPLSLEPQPSSGPRPELPAPPQSESGPKLELPAQPQPMSGPQPQPPSSPEHAGTESVLEDASDVHVG